MIASARWIASPLLYGALAAIIVLIGGALASSRLTVRTEQTSVGQVERVSVTKRIVVAPPQQRVVSTSSLAPLIARTAKVSLYVANVDNGAASLTRIAQSNGGDVFSSDIANGDGATAQPNGTMELRVPARRFDGVMDAIARSGTVREQSTSAQDLTADITDSGARLRNLRSTEADIRRIMERSGSVAQVMDAEMQLSQVREQIETLESELKDMRTRVAYATIDVDLQAEINSAPVVPNPASQLASAWHAAVASLGAITVGIVAFILWIVVFVPYLLAAALVVWLLARKRRRASLQPRMHG